LIVGCLALNASFEPLTMVPLRRALRLVIDGKAEIVEADADRVVRSERLTLPRPVVIRLTRFIHVPRRFRRQVTNTFLFARDRYRCQYCGRLQIELKPRESLTRDHLIPLSRGGANDWTNVVTACSPCNTRKANNLPSEIGMHPMHAPVTLRAPELGGATPHRDPGQVYPALLRRRDVAPPRRPRAASPSRRASRRTLGCVALGDPDLGFEFPRSCLVVPLLPPQQPHHQSANPSSQRRTGILLSADRWLKLPAQPPLHLVQVA
jgi:5-methylcytosine-specific restriction endonuclease McrA